MGSLLVAGRCPGTGQKLGADPELSGVIVLYMLSGLEGLGMLQEELESVTEDREA